MFTMNDLFEIAIKMEGNGENTYIKSIERIGNKGLKPLLKWMADEEASHARWFSEQKNRLTLETQESNLKEMVPRVLQDMMGENTLSLEEVNFERFTKVSQLLETFIEFEKETIQFYELLEMFIEDENTKKGLHTIILEEKKHIEQLSSMIESVTEESL